MAFNSNDISQYFVRINWGLSSKHKRNTILKVVTDSVHLFLEMTSRVCWISRSQGSTQTVGRGWRRRASHTTPSYWWIITVIFFSFFSSFNLENIFIRYWWRVTCSVAKTVTNFPLNFLTFFRIIHVFSPVNTPRYWPWLIHIYGTVFYFLFFFESLSYK